MSRRVRLLVAGLTSILLVACSGAGAYAALGGTSRPASTSNIDLQKGLVGWWKLDGNAKDSSPNGNHGTVTAATPTTDRKGQANGAYSFDGTTAYINVGHPAALNFTGDFSYSYWLRFSTAINGRLVWYPLSKGNYNSSGWSSGVLGTAAGLCGNVVGSVYFAPGTGAAHACTTPPLAASTWYHLTTTVSGTSVRNYINGQLAGTGTTTVNFNAATDLNIGRRADAVWNVAGSMDDVRIWKRALEPAEVAVAATEYDAAVSLASGEHGLVGHWKLDGNARDATPYGNNGTASNTSNGSDRKGASSGSYDFNGTNSCVSLPVNASKPYYNPAAFTISAWIRPTSSSGIRGIVRLGLIADQRYALVYSGGVLQYSWHDGTAFQSRSSTTVLTVGQWTHVAVTKDFGNNLAFFVNGVAAGTTTVTTAPLNPAGMTIGSSICGMNHQFAGSIDDLRIYNRVLTAGELVVQTQSYRSQLTVSDLRKGLVGHWPMNGNPKDATPRANNGSPAGAPVLTSDRKGRSNSAYAFSGTAGQRFELPGTGPYGQFGMNSFTVASWIQTSESLSQRCIMSTAGSALGWRFGYGSGRPYYLIGDGVNYQEGTIGTTSLNNGQWHHLAITYVYAGNWTMTAYIDGVATGSVAAPVSVDGVTSNVGRIGNLNGTTGVVNGNIDDLRVYNRPLSASEIALLAREYVA